MEYQQPTQRFTEAEREVAVAIAEEAPPIYARPGVPMTARMVAITTPIVARILDYDTENMRNRREMQRGFMDALHLADVAGIPFPDEPPLVYPKADRWREITRLREKYKSVDLANPGSAEQKIYDAAEQNIESFDFNETPLRDVVTQIEDAHGIQVELDIPALEDAGLDPDSPITRSLSGISLRSALRLILGDSQLTYLIKDEVMLITTKDKASENTVIKVYPVGDLVLPVNPSSGVNPFQTGGGMGGQGGVNSGQGGGGGMGGGGGGMGGGGGGMFQVTDSQRSTSRKETSTSKKSASRNADSSNKKSAAEFTPQPRVSSVKKAPLPIAVTPTELVLDTPATIDRIGLPSSITDSTDLRTKVRAISQKPPTNRPNSRDLAKCESAAQYGRQGDYKKAGDVIAAAISAGCGTSRGCTKPLPFPLKPPETRRRKSSEHFCLLLILRHLLSSFCPLQRILQELDRMQNR